MRLCLVICLLLVSVGSAEAGFLRRWKCRSGGCTPTYVQPQRPACNGGCPLK